MIDLDTLGGSFLGGSFSQATALNERGEAVGLRTTADDAATHAGLWKSPG
jgi:hypothetical protein